MGWMGEVGNNVDKTRALAGAAAVYTTESDFCRLFKKDMRALYTLALLLTADAEQAERCFVAGLDDCINSNPVFKDWAHAWSRRAIIMNAIRDVFGASANRPVSIASTRSEGNWIANRPLATVIRLESLERFVFVMSLLEGYSDHECSVLLNRSRKEVVAARTLALRRLAESGYSMEIQDGKKKVPAVSHAAL